MGGKDSKQAQQVGNMFIEMEQITQVAGQLVTGIVHLDLKQSFQTMILQLELEGIESTKWVIKQRHGKHTFPRKLKGKNNIIFINHAIHNFPNSIAATGQYSFPFSIQLPAWLPSSFIYYGPKRSEMKVTYQIKAFMEEINQPVGGQAKSIQSSRRIIVRQPAFIGMNKQVSVEKNITTLFFVKQGLARVDVLFEKDAYQPDENANIICKIDNSQCQKDIDRIQVKLKRTICCQDKNKKTFNQVSTVVRREYPGIESGQKKENHLVLNLKEINHETKYIKKQKLKEKKKAIEPEDFAMAELMLPSIHTPLISCIYTLEVHFVHKGMTLGSKIPPAILNLNIYAPSIPPQLHQIQAPMDWNPNVYQNLIFQIPEQQPYQQMMMQQVMVPPLQDQYSQPIVFHPDDFPQRPLSARANANYQYSDIIYEAQPVKEQQQYNKQQSFQQNQYPLLIQDELPPNPYLKESQDPQNFKKGE